jgi:hypothetical protein
MSPPTESILLLGVLVKKGRLSRSEGSFHEKHDPVDKSTRPLKPVSSDVATSYCSVVYLSIKLPTC